MSDKYPLKVTLGQHTYDVYPQRHAYLNHRLGQWVDALQDVSAAATENVDSIHGFLGLVGDRAYELLKILIPDLMPEYEFRGYATQEAFDALDYSEEYDRSPTYDEIVSAFEVTLKVNRLDALRKVGSLVDPRVIRAWITAQVGTFLSQRSLTTSSARDTAGLPTTSGTTPPTSGATSG